MEPTIKEVLQELEAILKDKPNYDKLPGGSGYKNGYADGYKKAVSRFKDFRDELQKQGKK